MEVSKCRSVEVSKCRSVEVSKCRSVFNLVCLTSVAASLQAMSGCATPPTGPEMRDTYREARRELDDAHRKLIEICDALEGEAKATCIQKANEWLRIQYTLASEGYLEALNGNWDAVRERQEKIEEELLDMLPNFPELRDIFNLGGLLNLNGSGQFRIVVGQSPIGDPIPVQISTYNFTGDISIERKSESEVVFTDDAVCTGSLDMHVGFSGLQANGVIRSGSLIATMQNGEVATLIVVKDTSNKIITDASGFGSIVFLAKLQHSLVEWDSMLPSLHRVYLPIQVVSPGSIVIDSDDSQLGTISPFVPMIHSDYNQNGVLDFSSDYVSFLAGHLAAESLADINHDFVWNQEDIDLWIGDFEFDLEHVQ